MSKTTEILLDDIAIDPEIQPRVKGLNEATVAGYADALERGDVLPPAVVFRDPDTGEHRMAAGFHRHAAHLRAGRDRMSCEVRDGGPAAARLFAAGSNRHNPLQMTNEDKRNAVRMTLIATHGAWTDRKTANHVSVNDKMAGDERAKLEESGDIPFAELRLGLDGKMHRATRKTDPPAHEREWYERAAKEGWEYIPQFSDSFDRLVEHSRTVSLPIADVRTDWMDRPKDWTGLDERWVQGLASVLRAGRTFRHTLVACHETGPDGRPVYRLVDGFHRIRAAEIAGAKELWFDVVDGIESDAHVMMAMFANMGSAPMPSTWPTADWEVREEVEHLVIWHSVESGRLGNMWNVKGENGLFGNVWDDVGIDGWYALPGGTSAAVRAERNRIAAALSDPAFAGLSDEEIDRRCGARADMPGVVMRRPMTPDVRNMVKMRAKFATKMADRKEAEELAAA